MVEFIRKKLLTVPVLKFVQDSTRYVKITGEMHLGKEQAPDKDGKKKDPAMLANCVNLEDGTECQIIMSAVLKGVFTDNFEGSGYVGKCFAITKRGRNPGKAYNQYDVEEIVDPASAAAVAGNAGDAVESKLQSHGAATPPPAQRARAR